MKRTTLLTTSEAAAVLRLSPARVRKFARDGIVPHVTLPDGELRFPEEALWTWVDSKLEFVVQEPEERHGRQC